MCVFKDSVSVSVESIKHTNVSNGHTLTCPVDTFTVLAGHICVFDRANTAKCAH